MKKTKIICTIGPACSTKEKLLKLISSGMNVARINMSHGEREDHEKVIMTINELRNKEKISLPIIIDTKGPEIRILKFKDGFTYLEDDKQFIFTTRNIDGNENEVELAYKPLIEKINIGNLIYANNGMISLKVVGLNATDIICQVISGGKLSNNKGLNIPGISPTGEYLSEKDKADILVAIKNKIEFIAASFVYDKSCVQQLKTFLMENKGEHISIISKIENGSGVENIDEIIEISDGIMIARGDMGVEMPAEQLPAIQKLIIKRCNEKGKFVIVATEMLESMIENMRPTRAEVSDVANAIYDGTSAIMLSGETAVGKHPDKVVSMMTKIAIETEHNINYVKRFYANDLKKCEISQAISHSTINTALQLDAKIILTLTNSGSTANQISCMKPSKPIIGVTAQSTAFHKMGLYWGVTPKLDFIVKNDIELIEMANKICRENNFANSKDKIVVASGILGEKSGLTNSLKAIELN